MERADNWEFIVADELDDFAGCFGSEAFFEVVDAVIFAGFVGKALDAVEVISFVFMLDGVFNHMPLDQVLGVVFFHVLLVAAGEQIDNFVAIEDKHGGRERNLTCFGEHVLHFTTLVEEVVHLFVVTQWAIGKIAAVAGGLSNLFEDTELFPF